VTILDDYGAYVSCDRVYVLCWCNPRHECNDDDDAQLNIQLTNTTHKRLYLHKRS